MRKFYVMLVAVVMGIMLGIAPALAQDVKQEPAKAKEWVIDRVIVKTAEIDDVKVKKAEIELAKIKKALIKKAKIKEAEVERLKVSLAEFEKAHFEYAKIKQAEVDNLKVRLAEIEKANIKLAEIELARIKKAEVDDMHIKRAEVDKMKVKEAEIEFVKKSKPATLKCKDGKCWDPKPQGKYFNIGKMGDAIIKGSTGHPDYDKPNLVSVKTECYGNSWKDLVVVRNATVSSDKLLSPEFRRVIADHRAKMEPLKSRQVCDKDGKSCLEKTWQINPETGTWSVFKNKDNL